MYFVKGQIGNNNLGFILHVVSFAVIRFSQRHVNKWAWIIPARLLWALKFMCRH